jgi:FkbM family methyltransferase
MRLLEKIKRFSLKIAGISSTETLLPELKSTKTKELSYHQTKTGNYYLPKDAHGDCIAKCIKDNQIFDEDIIKIAQKYILPGTAVLDVGANFGQMTVLFSKYVGKTGKVYSFDADDFIFDILQKNTRKNGCHNVECIFGAVYKEQGETLYFPEQDFLRFQTYGSYGINFKTNVGRKVETLTIDSLDISMPISFMKIDVQGSDLFVMQGAVKTIKKYKMPIIFEFEHLFQDDFDLSFQEYVDFVSSINYRFERVVNGQNYLILPK